jgi:hypothetical protein
MSTSGQPPSTPFVFLIRIQAPLTPEIIQMHAQMPESPVEIELKIIAVGEKLKLRCVDDKGLLNPMKWA